MAQLNLFSDHDQPKDNIREMIDRAHKYAATTWEAPREMWQTPTKHPGDFTEFTWPMYWQRPFQRIHYEREKGQYIMIYVNRKTAWQ